MVKYQVVRPDGQWRGGLVADGVFTQPWEVRLPSGDLERMLQDGSYAGADWFLLCTRGSPDIVGSEATDDAFDRNTRAHLKIVPQVYSWFVERALGPPAHLHERVVGFVRDWDELREAPGAREILRLVVEGGTADRDVRFDESAGPTQQHVDLLVRLDLIVPDETRDALYRAVEWVASMGFPGVLEWLDRQIQMLPGGLGCGLSSAERSGAGLAAEDTQKHWEACESEDGQRSHVFVLTEETVKIHAFDQRYEGKARRAHEAMAELLDSPHEVISAWTLQYGDEMQPPPPSEFLMDDTSLRDMRAEAARLDAEVQDALELGQYEKAALLSAEKDAIEEGIAKATGLRGRNRRHTDECERARKAVAVGLKRALRHIGEKAPKIASHLENSIQAVRGTGWVYRPGGGEVIRVERRS